MNPKTCLTAFACAGLLAAAVSVLGEDAATQPSDTDVKAVSARSHIVAPFNLLPDLTDDQKLQIRTIHAVILAQEKALHDKEREQITAILTEDQKKELDDLESRAAADKKAASAEHRADIEERKAAELKQQADTLNASTTQPSGASN